MKTQANITQQRRLVGISLIETVLAMLIIGGAFVASLNTIASARASQAIAAQQRLGLVLAEDLMEEILTHRYREDPGVLGILGVELGENTGDRSNYDDIDDYNGWASSPPTDIDGNTIVGAEGYTRTVQVNYVTLMNPAMNAPSDEGMLRITVTVYYGSKEVAQLKAYRSNIYESTGTGY